MTDILKILAIFIGISILFISIAIAFQIDNDRSLKEIITGKK